MNEIVISEVVKDLSSNRKFTDGQSCLKLYFYIKRKFCFIVGAGANGSAFDGNGSIRQEIALI